MNERQRKVKMARKSCQVKTSPWSFDLKINIYSIIKDFVATVCVLDISNDKVFFFITMMAIEPQCAPTLVKCHLWSMTLLVWLCDFVSNPKLIFLAMFLYNPKQSVTSVIQWTPIKLLHCQEERSDLFCRNWRKVQSVTNNTICNLDWRALHWIFMPERFEQLQSWILRF